MSDWKLSVMSAAELAAMPIPPLKPTYGDWHLFQVKGGWELWIDCYDHGGPDDPETSLADKLDYCLRLSNRPTSAHLLDWIFQVHYKRWMTGQRMLDLLAAIQDIYSPQNSLCSFGREGKWKDPRAIFEKITGIQL